MKEKTVIPELINTINKNPSVSIAIPAYNEATNIRRVIQGFLSSQYPNLVEILVADGGSTDGTQEIIQQLAMEDPRVKLLHNPLKLQSAGLNLILGYCQGDIFLRADAHAEYATDYIECCVEALVESGSLNAGGAQRFVAQTDFQAGIALATKSWLGSGGAKYRDPNYTGYAETVYLGCFWRKVLVGLAGYDLDATCNEDSELNLRLCNSYAINTFDTSQVTNQDAELNLKLLDTADQAIYISSKVRVWYYPRKSWKALWIQYFKYGRGRYLTSTKHTTKRQLRGMLPFILLSSFVMLGMLSLVFPVLKGIIVGLIALSCLLVALESFRVTLKYRKTFAAEIWRGEKDRVPTVLEQWLFCGMVLITLPIAHSSGYGYQLLQHQVLNRQGW